MLSRPKYDENGKKVLCEMGGVNSEMNMDIYVKKLAAGEVLDIARIKTNAPFYCFRARCILRLAK